MRQSSLSKASCLPCAIIQIVPRVIVPPRVIHLPGQQQAVGDRGRLNAHEVKKALGNAKQLRPAALKRDAAGAGVARQFCIRKAGVLAGRGRPAVEVLIQSVRLLNADAGAVGSAQFDSGCDKLIQNPLRGFDKHARQPVHALDVLHHIAHMQLAAGEGLIPVNVDHL